MDKQWHFHHPDPETVRTLSQQIGCSPLIARLLTIRGIQSKAQAIEYFNPSLQNLVPPFKMAGMGDAVRRIHRALKDDEKILVYGDYDADGITATALLTAFLRSCDATVRYFIPHRITHGYGMDIDFIKSGALPTGVGLIITADCGTGSGDAITAAKAVGIHTIVTDHHPVVRMPEDAVAVINPARPDCPANLAHLAGVGVAFYLIIALRAHLRKKGYWDNRREPNLKKFCELVAIGTVADVAPLVRENRILTHAGLKQINAHTHPGIATLLRMSGSPDAPADAETIAYRLAPRLNAAGRLVHARMACELLLTSDKRKADRLARALCRLNSRRQSMENDLLEAITNQIVRTDGGRDRSVLVLAGDRWHEGILGIVAARLTRLFNRPTVILSNCNGISKGSARSVDGIDLSEALGQCQDLLERYGGHALAAGLTLKSANIARLRNRLASVVANLSASNDNEPSMSIDASVPLEDVTPQLMNGLDRLGPYGQGNPYPLFVASAVRVHTCQSVSGRHRRMILESASDKAHRLPAIQFNVNAAPLRVNRFEKIAYRPQWNYWNGKKQLQLLIEATDPHF